MWKESVLSGDAPQIAPYLDFLTEGPPALTGTCNVNEVAVYIIPGVNRTFESRRVVTVRAQAGLLVYTAKESEWTSKSGS